MSFLIDPPLLYSTGQAYGRLTRRAPENRARDATAGSACIALFWGVSIALYLDRRWTRPVWRMCRAASGRDWMLNSGVLRLDWRKAGLRTHQVSAAIFATYPVWLWLGFRAGRHDEDEGAAKPVQR
jgi:hypothetical protein